MMEPQTWAVADEDQAAALGLPPQRFGLVMLEDTKTARLTTWAGEPIAVSALDEHEGAIPEWDKHFTLEADGWPEGSPMRWEHRRR